MVKKSYTGKVADESVPMSFVRVLGNPYLRVTGLRCIAAIIKNFFLLQYRHAFLKGRVPVSKADHSLDGKIPFVPAKINIYLDFVAFWVRTISFILRNYGHAAREPMKRFIESMGNLYAFAAVVYKKNFSTTNRPFYISHPRFLLIHAVDPHLMCIPSLHVMVVIRTYTAFIEILKTLGDEKRFREQAEELREGALSITEAVLYVKQHSVNCIPSAMYAMTRFEPELFPPKEAERFVSGLFGKEKNPDKEDAEKIRKYILSLYLTFLARGKQSETWEKPLLDFMAELPRK